MGKPNSLCLIGHFCWKALKEDRGPVQDSGLWLVCSGWFSGKRLIKSPIVEPRWLCGSRPVPSPFWASVSVLMMFHLGTFETFESKCDPLSLRRPLIDFPLPSHLVSIEDWCVGSDEGWKDGWDFSLVPRRWSPNTVQYMQRDLSHMDRVIFPTVTGI